jgi:hypothetical protein
MRNLDIPTMEEDNMRTMSEWDVAELARTALAIYGIKAELEMGGGGTPEMFLDFMYGDEFVQLHYATYAFEGFCVETFDSYGDAEEHPSFPRLEIDRTRPIGKQIVKYLDSLELGKAVN